MVVRGCDSGWEGDISPCEGDACKEWRVVGGYHCIREGEG